MKKELINLGLAGVLGVVVGVHLTYPEIKTLNTFTASDRYGQTLEYQYGFEAGYQYAAEVGLRNGARMDSEPTVRSLGCFEDEVIIWDGDAHTVCWPWDDLNLVAYENGKLVPAKTASGATLPYPR